MEKFKKRIEQAKENSFLLHQVFNELESLIADKLVEVNKDVGKALELRFLWDHCGHPEYAIALEACQSVTNLTLNGHLGIDESITALISNVSTARHYGLLTDSIAQLMLRGSYQGSRHPFISLYEMQPESWPYILQQTSSIISSGIFEVQALKDIKPFVIYILCYGLYETQISLLCLLMEKLHSEESSIKLLIGWLLEALLWQHTQQNSERHSTNFYLMCVQHLCEYSIAQKDEDLGREVAIYLTSAMQDSHKKFGFGIHHCIYLLKQLNTNFTLCLEPIVVMISQFLLECQANCYEPILDLCLNLVDKPCNTYVWAMLQCAVLSIFTYSSKLESDVVKIVESATTSKTTDSPESKDSLRRLARSESCIQIAIATAELANNFEPALPDNLNCDDRQTSNQVSTSTTIFLFKCAVFWRTGDISALDDAVRFVSANKLYANPLLTLLLKKLTAPLNGPSKLAILYHLPALAVDKTCVPRVLQIYEALSSSSQLKPVRIRLLTELWKIEDRVYPYLEKAINNEHLQSEEFLIAKALAIDIICSNRSDKYGADLLSVISDLLNSSLNKLQSSSSATVATLSLRSLVSLCRAEVVDLKSVWDLLAPKLNQDNRSSVVSETCNLLGLTAELRIDNEEYDEFIHQAIATLFRVSITTAHSSEVRCLALRSLCRFQKKDFHLKSLPDGSKNDLKVPLKYLPAGKTEMVVKAEDVLDYVPGVCWMKLLEFYDGELLLTGFVPLLSHLIHKEIETMPIWIYRKAATDATKKNEPNNYATFLKEDSVLAALILYVQRICEINSGNRMRMSVALKVLGGPFERPLPPLNWTVLLPIAQQYDLESEFMEIVFSQTPHSYSAQTITEKVLSSEPLDGKLAMVALSYLGPICKTVSLKLVQDFLYRLLNNQQSEILTILSRLRHSLSTTDSAIPSEVKETIADILGAFFPILPDDLESAKQFASCFRLVSGPHHPLCDPSSAIAKKYIVTLLYASLESQSKTALDYLLKALQLTLYLPSLDIEVMELIHQCIDLNCKSSPNFLLQFLSFIQLTAMRSPEKDQTFSNVMNTLALMVGALSDSLVYSYPNNKDQPGRFIENLWEYFSLAMSRLFSQPQWIAVKKSMQDWILTMLEKENASVEQRRRLLDALPSMGGMEKEAFFRIMTSI